MGKWIWEHFGERDCVRCLGGAYMLCSTGRKQATSLPHTDKSVDSLGRTQTNAYPLELPMNCLQSMFSRKRFPFCKNLQTSTENWSIVFSFNKEEQKGCV